MMPAKLINLPKFAPVNEKILLIMEVLLQILTLLGAMCMFLYGMTLMSSGLQKAAGDKLRSFLASMTSTPWKGILTGIIVTALIQSSSGTTVMVVSMVNAGLLSLVNAVGIIMGANIGTTITAWLIALFGFSFDITTLALPFMILGVVMLASKSDRTKSIGQFVIGFCLLLIGLVAMKDSVPDLNKYPDTLALVKGLTSFGFWSIIIFTLVGTVLTLILQASSAAMALTMVFLANGWISFDMAIAMVLGENIGTTITANIAAAVGNYSAKRTALIHTVFNVFGVVLALVFFHPLIALIGDMVTWLGFPNPNEMTRPSDGVIPLPLQESWLYGICILHTVFNLANTLILVWFIPQLVKIVTKIVPTPEGEEEVFRLKFIQGGPLSTAELSLDEAKQEIIHFAEICYKDFDYMKSAIFAKDPETFSEMRAKLVKYEQITDRIEYEIATYLNQVSAGEISDASARRINGMYKIISELESLGDSGDSIGRILQRRNDRGWTFDAGQNKKIARMADFLDEAYKAMIDNLRKPYYMLKDITNAQDAEYNINECRGTLREEHIINIEENPAYKYQIGVFYMDIIAEMEKMGDFIINISEAQLAENERD